MATAARQQRLEPSCKQHTVVDDASRLAAALGKHEERGELRITLRGDLGTILEWTESRPQTTKTDRPSTGMSISVVAGVVSERATFRLRS